MFFKKNKDEEQQASQQLAQIAKEFVRQNKSKSRWKVFFLIIILAYIIIMSYITISQTDLLDSVIKREQPFVAEVILSGEVSENGKINADDALALLAEAFSAKNSKAIVLRLNSPGGSPVQAYRIKDGILRLTKHYDKKLFVVIEDICASACYLIASAADGIYANSSSIIGSIGVVISSFGAVDAIKKLGIDRRLYTAGTHKGFLDVFSPEDKYAIKHLKDEILTKSHQLFIATVKEGRGAKLVDDKQLFSGLVWLGDKSKDLGLIDGIGDAYFVANEIIGIKSRILYEKEKTLLESLTQSSAGIIVNNLMTMLNQQTIKL